MHETIQELLADLGIQPDYNATLQHLGNAVQIFTRFKTERKGGFNFRTFINKGNAFAGIGGEHE